MKKRLGSMLLTLAMVLTLAPAGVVPVRADDAPFGNASGTGDNAKYTLTNQTYTLTGNVTLAGYIHVPSGVTATIDLNEQTINRKLTSAIINGCVIKVNGSLTLKDSSTNQGGKITGGNSKSEGGGVYVGNGGTFTMESGTICENKCSGENGYGGGVYVANGGTFTMTGGTITGNTATNNNGGGVYVYGTFNLSGSANITGNRKGTNESAADYINNVYLPSGKKITVSNNLSTAKIGVRPAGTSNPFTSGLSGHGGASHFASDDMNYATKLVGGEAQLSAAYPVWVGGTQVTPENVSDVLGDGTVSYTPADGDTPAALTLNGATINTAYDYIYPYGSYVYIRTAGIFTAEKLKINVTDDSTITGVDTTNNYNNSYGVYAQADLEIAVADGKTLTVAGGSTTGTGSKDSYGVYVHSGSLQGFFTFSGPGTLNTSGGASATWWNYGILASGAVTISGGTVNATGHTGGSTSGGVRAESQGVTIMGGSLTAVSDDTSGGPYKNYGINCGVNISGGSLTASGNDEAISGTVKNAIAGTGWTTADGVRVTDFKGGSATVTVTYTLKDGQRGGGVVVWYVADGGKMEEIPTRSNRDEVTFTVAHFSNYAVVYDAERAASSAQSGYADCPRDAACPISAFSDADPKAWYHDGVHWALENGVMNGMDDGLFAPNGTTNRAQVATMLWRLAGRAQVSGESVFKDVAEGMWYTDAICWAAAQGVVTGFERDGMTVFDPNAAVTREQLAAMLYRCAKLNGQGFTGAWMFPLDYPDAADVSEWADEAMHWMVRKGIINGMDGRLKPQGSATRAQTATIFMRYFTASAE